MLKLGQIFNNSVSASQKTHLPRSYQWIIDHLLCCYILLYDVVIYCCMLLLYIVVCCMDN
jgi:hypothetical protein